MATHLTALGEIQERLTQIYNAQRHLKSDIEEHQQALVKCKAELERLDRVASEYVALLAPAPTEGITA